MRGMQKVKDLSVKVKENVATCCNKAEQQILNSLQLCLLTDFSSLISFSSWVLVLQEFCV